MEAHRSNICKKFESYALKNIFKKSSVDELTADEKEQMYSEMEASGVALYNEFINMKKYQRQRKSRREYRLDAFLFLRRRKLFYEKIKALAKVPETPEAVASYVEVNTSYDNEIPHVGMYDDNRFSFESIDSTSSVSTSQTVIPKNLEHMRFNYLSSLAIKTQESQPISQSPGNVSESSEGIFDAINQPSDFNTPSSSYDTEECEMFVVSKKNSQPIENYSQFENGSNLVSSTQN